ncbi:MAG: dihydropteroate synthase [Planctomycetota bacterium]|nr:dihydropteroate synthase [Planctomycetota bacterium]
MPIASTKNWVCKGLTIDLFQPLLVGILNVTPDSFSDGGQFVNTELALQHALKLVQDGAGMIDVGGESTRPGSTRISPEEQINRVVPVIEQIRKRSHVPISVDTTLAEVARVAIEAGANVINDVASGTEDEEIFTLASTTGAGLVLMHRRLPPEKDVYSHEYREEPESDNIVADICSWLLTRVEVARSHGVQPEQIALDPGLGFGKSVEQNWQIVHQTEQFVRLGFPVYMGASRKSFIGATYNIDEPKARDEASVEVAKRMALQSAHIFRVHNVKMHGELIQSPPHKSHT